MMSTQNHCCMQLLTGWNWWWPHCHTLNCHCEWLLTGWKWGATGMGERYEREWEGTMMTMARMGGTAPPTTTRGQTTWTQMMRNKTASAPALWATAHRVNCRWHSDDTAPPQLPWATACGVDGCVRVLGQPDGTTGMKTKGPRDINNISWALCKFLFYFLFHFFCY